MERAALNTGATRSLVKTEIKPEAMLTLVRMQLGAEAENKINKASTGETESDICEQLMATVSAKLPELLAQARVNYQTLAKTEEDEAPKVELNVLHRQAHLLAGAAGLSERPRIAQMAMALEALGGELRDKPAQITPSVLRTAAQAIDTLNFLIAAPPNLASSSLSSPKIFAVDDDRIAHQRISSALGKARLTARTLDDPVSAEVLLENKPFDLIFLDVEMPGQTGLDLCLKIREMPLQRATPVVFVTSH